jgi:hypothetical protein
MTGGAGCDKNVTGLRCPGQSNEEYMTEMTLWCVGACALVCGVLFVTSLHCQMMQEHRRCAADRRH